MRRNKNPSEVLQSCPTFLSFITSDYRGNAVFEVVPFFPSFKGSRDLHLIWELILSLLDTVLGLVNEGSEVPDHERVSLLVCVGGRVGVSRLGIPGFALGRHGEKLEKKKITACLLTSNFSKSSSYFKAGVRPNDK